MRVLELLDEPVPDSPAPIYVFAPGKANAKARELTFEPFLAERACSKFVEAYVDEANRDFAFSSYHADETAPRTVVDEAQTLPFLAERRVILVRNAERYATEDAMDVLAGYLEDPAEFTVLLLVAAKLDRRTRFYKSCERSGLIVECPMLDEKQAAAWIRAEAVTRGKNLQAAAAEALVHRSGSNLSDANNALNLVIDFVGPGDRAITDEDVFNATSDIAEEIIWSLTDAIAASDPGRAIEALRNLLDLGKHPDEIIGTLNWLLKTAYQITAGSIKSPFLVNKYSALAEKLGHRIPDAFALCTDTQFAMRQTGVDPEIALELFVLKLAFPGRRHASRAAAS